MSWGSFAVGVVATWALIGVLVGLLVWVGQRKWMMFTLVFRAAGGPSFSVSQHEGVKVMILVIPPVGLATVWGEGMRGKQHRISPLNVGPWGPPAAHA